MKKVVAAIAIIIVILLIGLGAWYYTNSRPAYSGTPESITIGGSSSEYSGLIYIAEDQGFFTRNGLNVTMIDYSSGPSSINGLLNGDVDIWLAPEFTVVGNVFNNENISIIGCIDKYQSVYLIARKNDGIENISDLNGKAIGVTLGGQREFYLGRFLDLNGMSISNVTLVNMPSSQYVQAITNGSVDAVITDQNIDQIKDQLGDNAVLWSAQSSQDGYYVMACLNAWTASHPGQIDRLLKSLDQAEQYAIDHPAEAEAIVQEKLNYSDEQMAETWPENQFSITLDQSLLTAMNDEGQWMIYNNLTSENTTPDYQDYIYTKGMEEVKPQAVNIND
jgi:NitT/TauT family transport system substrate-binding protein